MSYQSSVKTYDYGIMSYQSSVKTYDYGIMSYQSSVKTYDLWYYGLPKLSENL